MSEKSDVSITLLADQASGLLKTPREHEPDFILLDGTLVECDRVGDGRADYFAKHRRHGVNVQVVTDPGVRHAATNVTGSLPATASARPSFTSRRRCASASETAMFLDP